jgi:hypothetical protein
VRRGPHRTACLTERPRLPRSACADHVAALASAREQPRQDRPRHVASRRRRIPGRSRGTGRRRPARPSPALDRRGRVGARRRHVRSGVTSEGVVVDRPLCRDPLRRPTAPSRRAGSACISRGCVTDQADAAATHNSGIRHPYHLGIIETILYLVLIFLSMGLLVTSLITGSNVMSILSFAGLIAVLLIAVPTALRVVRLLRSSPRT